MSNVIYRIVLLYCYLIDVMLAVYSNFEKDDNVVVSHMETGVE